MLFSDPDPDKTLRDTQELAKQKYTYDNNGKILQVKEVNPTKLITYKQEILPNKNYNIP